MKKIRQLPLHEAQKIAAGEVVERPVNVVKELVENSIDAEARTIRIYIENGGHTLIKVVDDGNGMCAEDAHVCFDHHATSKITSVHDLPQLQSFGFRGEALASISAVAHVTLLTKEAKSTHGLKIERSQGKNNQVEAHACNKGTSIAVQELFFNVPARKKFLKTPQTEWRQIVQLFQAFCFDYTDKHFLLCADGKQVYNAPPVASIAERAAQLWDTAVSGHLITVDCTTPICVRGVISGHQYYRYDRSHMYLFVNKRWIKNQALTKAILKGYLNVIPSARFPATVIAIEVDPATVDINIHPRKQDVQFLHPRRIEQAVTNAVKQALEQSLSRNIQQSVQHDTLPEPVNVEQPAHHSFAPPPYVEPSNQAFKSATFDDQPHSIPVAKPVIDAAPKPSATIDEHVSTTTIQTDGYHILAQYNKTYILCQLSDSDTNKEGLFIVDQHAAHERILYEHFRSRFGSVATVTLLFPQVLTLSHAQYANITPQLELLHKHGIAIEPFGHDKLVIEATPVHLKNTNMQAFIEEISGLIQEQSHLYGDEFFTMLHERIHAQMACKAAVKAGDTLTSEQMNKLLQDLAKTANRFACPHGRPTSWFMTLDELEKKFRRKK